MAAKDSINTDQMYGLVHPDELDEQSKAWEPTPEQRQSHLASEMALQRTPASVDRFWEAHDEKSRSGQLAFEGMPTHHTLKHDEHRMEQARKMFPVVPSASPQHQTRKKTIEKAIYDSSIPTDAFSALSTSIETANEEGIDGRAWHNSLALSEPMLDRSASPEDDGGFGQVARPGQTLTHELGHVVDFRSNKGTHVGVTGDEARVERPGLRPGDKHVASPAGEGFADGIELRFSPESVSPKDPSQPDPVYTGFSDGYDPTWWPDRDDQASYVAHRTLAWTEGRRPHASNEGELGRAEAVHNAGQNPHVRAAIRANKLTLNARILSNQFLKTKHEGTQLSLLGDKYNKKLYSVPEVDWDY